MLGKVFSICGAVKHCLLLHRGVHSPVIYLHGHTSHYWEREWQKEKRDKRRQFLLRLSPCGVKIKSRLAKTLKPLTLIRSCWPRTWMWALSETHAHAGHVPQDLSCTLMLVCGWEAWLKQRSPLSWGVFVTINNRPAVTSLRPWCWSSTTGSGY